MAENGMAVRRERLDLPSGPAEVVTLFGVQPFQNNVYVLVDPASKECLVIDASEARPIEEAVQGLAVRAVLLTHGHWDHHQGLPEVRERLAPPVVAIGTGDEAMLDAPPTATIHDGDSFSFGPHQVTAIATPGHTPGSTCYLLGPILFSGDTLFPGGPGNTKKDSNPYGDFDQIMASLRTRLFTLPDPTRVLPGHGEATTIAKERPHMDEWAARGW